MEPRLEPRILDPESPRPGFSRHYQGGQPGWAWELEMGAMVGLEWTWS